MSGVYISHLRLLCLSAITCFPAWVTHIQLHQIECVAPQLGAAVGSVSAAIVCPHDLRPCLCPSLNPLHSSNCAAVMKTVSSAAFDTTHSCALVNSLCPLLYPLPAPCRQPRCCGEDGVQRDV